MTYYLLLITYYLSLVLEVNVANAPRSAFVAEVPQALHNNKSFQALKEGLFSPQGAVLGAGILLLVFLSMRGTGRKKGKLAKGKLGGIKEKRNAKKIALKQMSERKRQPAAVYVGRPSKTGRQPILLG